MESDDVLKPANWQPCDERDRLLASATEAARAHSEAVKRTQRISDTNYFATAEVLKRLERESRELARAAWDAYKKHVERHGC